MENVQSDDKLILMMVEFPQQTEINHYFWETFRAFVHTVHLPIKQSGKDFCIFNLYQLYINCKKKQEIQPLSKETLYNHLAKCDFDVWNFNQTPHLNELLLLWSHAVYTITKSFINICIFKYYSCIFSNEVADFARP